MKGCPHHGMKWIQPDTIEVIDPGTGERTEVRNPHAGRCLACRKFNDEHGGRQRHPKREKKDKGYQGRYLVMPDGTVERPKYLRPDGTADAKELSKYLGTVLADPVRTIGFFSENAHQKGVSRSQYGIAIRRANREPMLNGDPRQVTNALDQGVTRERKSRLPKMGIFKRIVVKPDSLATGKVAGWHERLWTIHRLKYAKGLVIVTDTGTESKTFPSWGEMESAIRKSGWRIIK